MKRFCLLLAWLSAWVLPAAASTVSVDADPDSGAQYPLLLTSASGSDFLAVGAQVLDSVLDSVGGVKTELESTWFSWSYNRGVGTVPDTCPAGFDNVLGVCAQQCPDGYSAALGACWQDCPAGYTDMGAICTNWSKFSSLSKATFAQSLVATSCASGMVNEAGLCYEPCAGTFTGIGPLCVGQFDGSSGEALLAQQVEEQHEAASAGSSAGIELSEDQAPELRTHVIFTPIMCSLDAIDGVFGVLPDGAELGAMAVNAAGDAVISAISDAIPASSGGVSYLPSLADTVLFDFSADASCSDDGVVASAGLSMDPSVTVKVSTRLFDPALHNLAGVDLGIMQLSVYELIPFRVYGTVGSTFSAPLELTSEIDRSLPQLLVEGQQYATRTRLSTDPGMDLWLSSEAYIRVTSLFSFIPDLLQLGAEFRLHVLDVVLPYEVEEGLRANDSGYELYRSEALASDLASGHGYVDTFLRVLGIETNAFGDDADIAWTGYEQHDDLLSSEEVTPVSL